MKLDCRFYLGDRPCGRSERCVTCEHYALMGERILIIKLAAAGDVLRATAILQPLKRKHANSHVTWVADESAVPLVDGNPLVDRAMAMSFQSWLVLSQEKFDVAVCLDKEPRAAALIMSVNADRKLGFGLSPWGTVQALNDGARYDLALGLSNEMKFHENEKTYPEIFCEAAELDYREDPYVLTLPEASVARAREFLAFVGQSGPLVGLNVGAGDVFANKAWTPQGFAALAARIANELGGTALVLGGAEDRDRAVETLSLAEGKGVDGGLHELLDFCAIVGSLDALVTGDTMAMHVAIALGVPVVVIVGPTVPQEIAFYGPGRKVVADIECAPCYRRSCDVSPSCMDAVGVDTVFGALSEVLDEG